MNINQQFVITISREVGSGGHTVGRLLAERLNVRFLDKQLIEGLIETFHLDIAEIERIKGKKKSWLEFFSQVSPAPAPKSFLSHPMTDSHLVTPDDLFECEVKLMKSFVEETSCVVAGRSGFFILREHPNKLNIFITASKEHRLERMMRRQNLSREEAEKVMKKVDTARENFVRRFAGTSRYDLRNYDLVLNMDNIAEEDAVESILSLIKRQSDL